MNIAVTGASGQLGRLVINHLKKKTPSTKIIALVRDLEKAKDLDVEARMADYTLPHTLMDATKGVDTLLLISGNAIGQRAQQHSNVIVAAKNSGVKRIVYTSLLRADRSPLNLASEHMQTEEELKASGIAFTILRNGWYSENYIGSILTALQTGALYGSAGEGRISSAPRTDYAEAAALVLSTEGHEGKTYELAGDNSYTLNHLATEISKLAGKEIPYKNIPEADYSAILKKSGLPEGISDAIASWDVATSKGALHDESRQLSNLIGRPTITIEEIVKQIIS